MVWAGKQIQYYLIFPTLSLSRWRPLSYRNWFLYDNGLRLERVKVSLEAIFSEMIGTNEKVFIFWPGNCSMNVLYPSPLKSFVLSICSRDSMKTQPTDIFARVATYSQMSCRLQSWWLFGRLLLSLSSFWGRLNEYQKFLGTWW